MFASFGDANIKVTGETLDAFKFANCFAQMPRHVCRRIGPTEFTELVSHAEAVTELPLSQAEDIAVPVLRAVPLCCPNGIDLHTL